MIDWDTAAEPPHIRVEESIKCHYGSLPFDIMSDDIDRWFWEELLFGSYFSTRPDLAGKMVLEVGCGCGRLGLILRRRLGTIPIGIDLSLESVRIARCRDICCVLANARSLPFRSETFEAAVCYGVLNISPVPEALLGELSRVVRKGGVAYISVYNRKHRYFLLYKYLVPIIRKAVHLPGIIGYRAAVGFKTLSDLYHRLTFGNSEVGAEVGRRILDVLFHDQWLIPYARFDTVDTLSQMVLKAGFVIGDIVIEDDHQMISAILLRER